MSYGGSLTVLSDAERIIGNGPCASSPWSPNTLWSMSTRLTAIDSARRTRTSLKIGCGCVVRLRARSGFIPKNAYCEARNEERPRDLAAVELRELSPGKFSHEVRLPGEHLRAPRRRVRGRREDHAIELRASAIIRRVGDRARTSRPVPTGRTETGRSRSECARRRTCADCSTGIAPYTCSGTMKS